MALEDLHRVGYLHRDIKPGSFATGREASNEQQLIYMLDFGLCRKFVGNVLLDQQQKDLRMPRASAPFRGTTRYASLAALRQVEQSRKDDIEAWLYMVVEWTNGHLPWRKLKGLDKDEVLRFLVLFFMILNVVISKFDVFVYKNKDLIATFVCFRFGIRPITFFCKINEKIRTFLEIFFP